MLLHRRWARLDRLVIASALGLLFGVPEAAAQQRHRLGCESPGHPWKRYSECKHEDFDFFEETLIRSLASTREAMKERGITATLGYSSSLMGNLSGGSNRALAYAGQLSASMDLKLDQLLRVPGVSLQVNGTWGTGTNLSATLGNLMPISEIYATGYFLGEMYLEARMRDGAFTVDAGRLVPGLTFAFLPAYSNYLNGAVNPNPVMLPLNDSAFAPLPPGTQWGAQALYYPARNVEVLAGVFNNNPNSAAGARHGADFILNEGNKGALWTVQANYLVNARRTEKGKPGQYSLGGFYDTNRFATVSGGAATSNGNYGIYVMGQQMVYREEDAPGRQGLTVWGTASHSTKQNVSLLPLFTGGGLNYEGLVPRRDQDIASVGWFYGKLSRYVPGTTAEHVLEVSYTFLISRAVSLGGNFQYVKKPGGYAAPGAAVLGAVLEVTF
jgi:porin